MHEIPPAQRALFALDDQQRLAGEDEEVLLVGLPVVHGHRLAGPENADVDPDLREVRVTLEVADRRTPFRMAPGRVARIQDEPAVPCGNESVLGRLEPRLRNHRRDPAIPVVASRRPAGHPEQR